LIVVDTFVYHFLQSVHTPVMDRLMLALTELGGPRVLLSVILVALAWFLAHRFWLTAGYWVATVGIAEVMVKVVKLSMHRPRPTVYLGGVEQFSFPSGHATMSVVIYGFLAFLLCRKASPGLRKGVLASVTLVILLIAFSRVYLGAHWLSDVLGGFGLGTAWIAALSIAYAYQSHEQLRPRRFAAVMLVTMLLAEASHFVIAHGTTRSPEAPRTMASPTGSP
jgi:cation-transporting ATPase E/undecaprenyl-diphosphatase